MSVHNVNTVTAFRLFTEQLFGQFTFFSRWHSEKYLEENTLELICGSISNSRWPTIAITI